MIELKAFVSFKKCPCPRFSVSGSFSLKSCPNETNTRKLIQQNQRQHLLRAKSETGNFGLFFPYPCHFFYLVFVYYQRNSLTNPMLVTAFGLSVLFQRWLRAVSSLLLTEWQMVFNCNVVTQLTPQLNLKKTLSRDLHPVISKCGNFPQYTKQVYIYPEMAFRLVKYLIECKM